MTVITYPISPDHENFDEFLCLFHSRGMFKLDIDTSIVGISKLSCLRDFGIEPYATSGGVAFPDVYSTSAPKYYDSATDRVYVAYKMQNVLYSGSPTLENRLVRFNPRTGTKELQQVFASNQQIFTITASASRVFVTTISNLVVLDKTNFSILATIPYPALESLEVVHAISDTQIVVMRNFAFGHPTSTGSRSQMLTVDVQAPSLTITTTSPNRTGFIRLWCDALNACVFVQSGTTTASPVIHLWNPLTGVDTPPSGSINVTRPSGSTLSLLLHPLHTTTHVKGSKILVNITLNYDSGQASAPTIGALEIDLSNLSNSKYYGLHYYVNGTPSAATTGTLIRKLQPIVTTGNKSYSQFFYGPNNKVYVAINNFNVGHWLNHNTNNALRLYEWNGDGGLSTITATHYPNKSYDLLEYGHVMTMTISSFSPFVTDFRELILLPSVPATSDVFEFNSTPPATVVALQRVGTRYMSPVVEMLSSVAWFTIEHDGVDDIRITYDVPEDRSQTSENPDFGSLPYPGQAGHVVIYNAQGKALASTGTKGQVPLARGMDEPGYFPATLPACYPAGTYYVLLVPGIYYLESGLYSDHEFSASGPTVGITRLRLRIEHLKPAYNQILPEQQTPLAPLTSVRLYPYAEVICTFGNFDLFSADVLVNWNPAAVYYFRVYTEPMVLRSTQGPVITVQCSDPQGTATLGDIVDQIAAQLPGFEVFIGIEPSIVIRRSQTFMIVDGQFNGDTNLFWANGIIAALTSLSPSIQIIGRPAVFNNPSAPLPTVVPTITGSVSYQLTNTSDAQVNSSSHTLILTTGQTLLFGTVGITGTSIDPVDNDTYIRLYGPQGNLLATSDDYAGTLGSRISYLIIIPGTYTLVFGCYGSTSCSATGVWEVYD